MQHYFYGYPMYYPMFPYFLPQNQMIPMTYQPIPYIQPQQQNMITSVIEVDNQGSKDRQAQRSSSLKTIQKPKQTQTQKLEDHGKKKRHQRYQKKHSAILYPAKKSHEAHQTGSARYTMKNIQSNIVNQVYSFLWNEPKNKLYLSKFFEDNKEKITLYFQYFKIIRRSNKRHLNKTFLTQLFDYKPGHLGYAKIIRNQRRLEYLSIAQFSSVVKYLTRIYLLKFCSLSIVTSRKMRRQVWIQHLKKARQVYNYIFLGEEMQENCINEEEQNEKNYESSCKYEKDSQ